MRSSSQNLPLSGLTVIEMAGLGPAPFCAMMLADMGADIIRIDRPPTPAGPFGDTSGGPLNRGRRSIALDLKKPESAALLHRLIAGADVLLEGFRPGVMEKLGVGPDACLANNPKLVYARMTGWGQHGPLAHSAGHDINYIALTGALHAMGEADTPPPPPLNLVGDYGGGAMVMAFGIVCALLEAGRSGQGQVIDAAMTDGAALLMTPIYAMLASGLWQNARASNFLDGAAPFYGTYTCRDGRYMAVGPIEPQFYQLFLERLGLADQPLPRQWSAGDWPALRGRVAAQFLTRPRDDWAAIFEGTDACCVAVLDLEEAPCHPHNRARETFVDIDGAPCPAPAPRLSRTPARVAQPVAAVGADSADILAGLGCSPAEIDSYFSSGVAHRAL